MNTSEGEVIKKLRSAARPSGPQLRLGVGDDAALFVPRPGHQTILTCDWFLEGTHFLRPQHPPDSVGWKCLARAVSDIAAMGGQPKCFLLSLALPPADTSRWLTQFLIGLQRAARKFHCVFAGGDTTGRREILISVTVVGEIPAGRAILRSGARVGDLIYVSGRLGEADLGLQLLRKSKSQANKRHPFLRKHLYPEPRLALGQWLAKSRIASALMDLSDGLSTDLPRLCAASGVGAWVDAKKVPCVPLAASPNLTVARRLALALNGGDDYELLFTVRPKDAARLPHAYQHLAITQIGEVTRSRHVTLVAPNGATKSLVSGGWDPFRK